MGNGKKGKIIMFPQTKERLIEEAFTALEAKQYKEALRFLRAAEQLGDGSFPIRLGLAVCCYELGDYDEAEWRLAALLDEQPNNSELLQMYVALLLQTNRYREAEAVIRAALRRQTLPVSLREQLRQLLRFSEKMNARPLPPAEWKRVKRLLESEDIAEQMQLIKQLEKEDIAPVLSLLKQYLREPKKSPMAKTMLLRLLTVKQIDEAVTVEKFGQRIDVIPSALNEQAETEFASTLLRLLEQRLTAESPSLYETAAEIWLRYAYILYPFPPEPVDADVWLAALHWMASRFQGMDADMDALAARYGVAAAEMAKLCKKLHEIEKLSYL
ncbi:hydrolase [Geobacillus sp. 46C-IIa]|uniref:tetratricopeptide repeat protein n=1 Tax=Geobacillus sp. 46C-IIa TaxID=1963025 RepID=UPI0009BCEEAF|nr:tetratricopeptide repeat protein [Geobacillus sp. 46C-IIa]OQP06358.1 hydrolase [Geobacillus sp. 46C-IIa]QNU28652.1 tetratricopeptide repeat protein [Geobacillus sp. 46C-IIa]